MLVLERDAVHVGYLVRDENQASMVAQLLSELDGEDRRVPRITPAPIYSPRDIGDDQDRTHWNREILWCRSIRMRSSTEQFASYHGRALTAQRDKRRGFLSKVGLGEVCDEHVEHLRCRCRCEHPGDESGEYYNGHDDSFFSIQKSTHLPLIPLPVFRLKVTI